MWKKILLKCLYISETSNGNSWGVNIFSEIKRSQRQTGKYKFQKAFIWNINIYILSLKVTYIWEIPWDNLKKEKKHSID